MIHASIYVGAGFKADGGRLNAEFALVEFENLAARKAGGYTVTRTSGGWIDQGKLIEEPGFKFDISVDDEATARILAIAAKELFEQQAVLLETQVVNAQFV